MITFTVRDGRQIIVPLGFARASGGYSEYNAPDVDDRGFIMGQRPGTWGASSARTAMVGLMVNAAVRVKVLLHDIDAGVALYPVSTDPAVVKVVAPEAGQPIGPDGIVQLRGIKDFQNRPVKIQVHLGGPEGPVLGELEPHVFNRRQVSITPHRVCVDSSAGAGAFPNFAQEAIEQVTERVRSIWWPCGIEVVYDPDSRPTVEDHIQLSQTDVVQKDISEIRKVMGLQRKRLGLPPGVRDPSVNWYVIRRFSDPDFMGIGLSRKTASSVNSDTGIITAVDFATDDDGLERVAITVSHEIGHFFTLKHVQDRDGDNPVDDTYGRRQLMFPYGSLPKAVVPPGLTTGPRVDDVGYGPNLRGCLLTLKDHPRHITDGECQTARHTVAAGAWY